MRRWITALCGEQDNKNPNWKHIEDAGDVEQPEAAVDDTRALVEACPLRPDDLCALVLGVDFVMVDKASKLVVDLRLEV
jgi:hypothetical protein